MPPEWWEACADAPAPLPAPDLAHALVLGVDASVSGDSTALVGVARHPDRPGHPMELVVRIARIWQPTPAHPMDYEATVMQAIREACAQWNVMEVTYDPYQLHNPMLRLRRENRVKVLFRGGISCLWRLQF